MRRRKKGKVQNINELNLSFLTGLNGYLHIQLEYN